VPPDTSSNLKGKQVDLLFKLALDNINEPVIVEAPKESITIGEIMKNVKKQYTGASGKAEDAMMKANLSIIRASAELAYDTNNNSYGKNPFALGSCKATADTLFADEGIRQALEEATDGDLSLATCVSEGTTNKVESYAISVPLPSKDGFSYCIDSFGSAQEIVGELSDATCR
jgi:hypothetical protein